MCRRAERDSSLTNERETELYRQLPSPLVSNGNHCSRSVRVVQYTRMESGRLFGEDDPSNGSSVCGSKVTGTCFPKTVVGTPENVDPTNGNVSW